MVRLGILGSTRGTTLQAVIDAISAKRLQATIAMVVSNKQDALILNRANAHGLPHRFIDASGCTREEYDKKIIEIFLEHAVDLVLLIGYMRIVSPLFISHWPNKILNVHPSLLPAFAGQMDIALHRAVLASGVKETGCSVHEVIADLDAGPVRIQKKCPVLPNDTPETLKARVQQLEGGAMVEAILSYC